MLQLIQATQKDDANEFARILSHHPNPSYILNQRDSDGWTIAHHAAYGNNADIVALILEKGGLPHIEIPRVRNTPLHLALMSRQENSGRIAMMVHTKAIEQNQPTPRANREGNHPLHLAVKVGHEALVKDLLKQNSEAKYKANKSGMTPLGIAISNGHRKIMCHLIESTLGSPTQFEDFETIFHTYYHRAQKSLAYAPVKVFVVGDNSSGKSTLIKSIQGESFYDRIWGIAYNTPNVPNNKVGVVPADYLSKKFGKVIFYDLASGANTVHHNLLDTSDDLDNAMFIVVIDNRSEKRVMEQRLEFWLSFIQMQCGRFFTREVIYNQADPHSAPNDPSIVRPNVLVVASFGELHQKPFRNSPAVRLNLVVRSVCRHNREISSRVNIVSSIALDCRRAESPPMTQLRDELSRMCRQLRPRVMQPHSQCYILSEILRQLQADAESSSEEESHLPVMKLGSLASLVKERSCETEPNLYHLLPQDSEELLILCRALEDIGRLILIPSSRGEDNPWIIYGKEAVANKLDELFISYLKKQNKPMGSTALMTREALEECLQPVVSVGMDLLTNLLEHFKIHDSSVREITNLPSEPPFFFFPTLLSTSLETDDWETEDESNLCFGWSIVPCKHQCNSYFLPRLTKTLLLLLFQKCGSTRDFEHRCLWSEGIHFQDKISAQHRQLEFTIIATCRAVILNMRFHSSIEIPTLYLRNMILREIRSHKDNIQPQTKVEESLILKEGTTFPVRSPSMPRIQYPIEELKKNISKSSHSLAFSLPPSGTSTPTINISHVSGSSSSLEVPNALLFFEPSLHLPKLTFTNRLCLLHPDYSNSELTDDFLRNLQDSIGTVHYKAMVEFFDLPIVPNTPTSSVHGSQSSIVPVNPHQSFKLPSAPQSVRSEMAQLSSMHSNCDTFGKLVECLDTISICNTVEVLEEAQRAQLSSSLPTSTPTPTHTTYPNRQLQDLRTLSPVTPSRSIYPHTTVSPSASCSGVDLSSVHFMDSLDVIAVGPAGGVFHSKSNNVTITFPEGAVPSGIHSVNVEFGVALLGPFDMPDNHSDMKPVSPFVWICTDVKDFKFSKPLTVIMPHFVSCDTQQDCKALVFMEADGKLVDEEGRFQFMEPNGTSKFNRHSMKGSLSTLHSGFLCICSIVSSIAISKANYCLMMLMPKQPDQERFEVTFCITYLLETCIQVVSRQFPEDEFKIQKKEVKLVVSSAAPEEDNFPDEPEIRINFQPILSEGWVAANISGHWEIPVSSIAFWNRDIDELNLLDRHKMYPPRFVIEVNGTSALKASCLSVDFTGLRRKVQYQITLSCPRRYRYSSAESSSLSLRKSFSIGHPLDRNIKEINKYLNVEEIRLSLRARGSLTDDEMEKLTEMSVREVHRVTIIETLIKYLKSKGDEGMLNFKMALEETQDGTGHATILDILNEDDEVS